MRTVTKYVTKDGREHDSEEAALVHEKKSDYNEFISDARNLTMSGRHGGVDHDMIERWLTEHRALLLRLLKVTAWPGTSRSRSSSRACPRRT